MKTRLAMLVVAMSLVAALGGLAWGDAAACRTNQIDPRVRRVPAELTRAAFAAPQPALQPLVAWLLQGSPDDFQKVKLLHDWIADNITYDAEALLAGNRIDAGVAATLARRKAVCQGYAVLLQAMCEMAQIPCRIIDGHGRGFGFRLGHAEDVSEDNHAWNVVRIGTGWQLIDVTWDAGHLDGREFRKQYSTAYLFPRPRDFLHTHFPSDAQWQLLSPPATAQEFAALPCLDGGFFQEGLQLVTPLRRLHPVGESVQFSIRGPADVVLMAQLKDPERLEANLYPRRTLVRRDGDRSNILVTFPKGGPWVVQILSKPRRATGLYWLVGTLEFQSAAGTPWTFPETFASFAAMDAFLYSPLYVPLTAGKPQEFKIRLRGATEVHLLLDGKQWLPMSQTAEGADVFHITRDVTADAAVRIMAKGPGPGDKHWTLVEFKAQK